MMTTPQQTTTGWVAARKRAELGLAVGRLCQAVRGRDCNSVTRQWLHSVGYLIEDGREAELCDYSEQRGGLG